MFIESTSIDLFDQTTQDRNIILLNEHCGLIEGDILMIFIKICDV